MHHLLEHIPEPKKIQQVNADGPDKQPKHQAPTISSIDTSNVYSIESYTVRHKLSITQTLFQRRFRVKISSEEQPACNILLPLSSFGLLNISECHLVILLKYYGVLYTPTPILGCTLKSGLSLTQNDYFEFK